MIVSTGKVDKTTRLSSTFIANMTTIMPTSVSVSVTSVSANSEKASRTELVSLVTFVNSSPARARL